MGADQKNLTYAFVKFKLEYERVISIKEIFKELDVAILAKDLGVYPFRNGTLNKKSFETSI